MADDPELRCSHCHTKGSVVESLWRFECIECGYWGPSPDQMIYESDDDEWRLGQVPRGPTE